MEDVIIIGAGPAGLFTAYELITNNPKLSVTILDKGCFARKRVCPMNQKGIPCQNCKPCAILSGYGGAGTFSDGKLNFIPKLGKSDLTKYMSESESYKLIDETEKIFNFFGMDAPIYPTNLDQANEIKKQVAIAGAKLLLIKQKHLGSDHLPDYIQGISDYLAEKVTCLQNSGAEVISLTAVTMHLVIDDIIAKTNADLISIPKAVCKEALSAGYKKIGLLGTIFTMEKDYMKKDFLEAGIEVCVPDKEDRDLVAKRIYEELEAGIVKESTLKELQGIIAKMRDEKGIEAVVLGCTELPLILNSGNCPVPCLDSVEIHINELIKQTI